MAVYFVVQIESYSINPSTASLKVNQGAQNPITYLEAKE